MERCIERHREVAAPLDNVATPSTAFQAPTRATHVHPIAAFNWATWASCTDVADSAAGRPVAAFNWATWASWPSVDFTALVVPLSASLIFTDVAVYASTAAVYASTAAGIAGTDFQLHRGCCWSDRRRHHNGPHKHSRATKLDNDSTGDDMRLVRREGSAFPRLDPSRSIHASSVHNDDVPAAAASLQTKLRMSSRHVAIAKENRIFVRDDGGTATFANRRVPAYRCKRRHASGSYTTFNCMLQPFDASYTHNKVNTASDVVARTDSDALLRYKADGGHHT